jgi:hypothetical protein
MILLRRKNMHTKYSNKPRWNEFPPKIFDHRSYTKDLIGAIIVGVVVAPLLALGLYITDPEYRKDWDERHAPPTPTVITTTLQIE